MFKWRRNRFLNRHPRWPIIDLPNSPHAAARLCGATRAARRAPVVCRSCRHTSRDTTQTTIALPAVTGARVSSAAFVRAKKKKAPNGASITTAASKRLQLLLGGFVKRILTEEKAKNQQKKSRNKIATSGVRIMMESTRAQTTFGKTINPADSDMGDWWPSPENRFLKARDFSLSAGVAHSLRGSLDYNHQPLLPLTRRFLQINQSL